MTNKQKEELKEKIKIRWHNEHCGCDYTTDMKGDDMDGVICSRHHLQALDQNTKEIVEKIAIKVRELEAVNVAHKGTLDLDYIKRDKVLDILNSIKKKNK